MRVRRYSIADDAVVHSLDPAPAEHERDAAPAASGREDARYALRGGLAAGATWILAATALIVELTSHPTKTWRFEYYPNPTLQGAAVHGWLGTPDFEIGADFSPGPAEALPRIAQARKLESDFPRGLPEREGFSVRMRTCFVVPTSGVYRVAVSADDGVRIFVDDQPQVEAWSVQAAESVKALQLARGRHSMTIEYVNTSGAARLAVRMSGTDPYQRPRSMQHRTVRMGDDRQCGAT